MAAAGASSGAAGATLPTSAAAYKGITSSHGRFYAQVCVNDKNVHLASCDTAYEAARVFDDAVRKLGRRVVNFPRAGTNEVQALKGELELTTLRRHEAQQAATGGAGGAVSPHAGAWQPLKRRTASPPPSEPQSKRLFTPREPAHGLGSAAGSAQPQQLPSLNLGDSLVKSGAAGSNHGAAAGSTLPNAAAYKGVTSRIAGRFRAQVVVSQGRSEYLATFATAYEAARAYDDAVRKDGRRVVNFPRVGTNEVQAVLGEVDKMTLLRHAAQQPQQAALGRKPATAPPPAKKPRVDERAPASLNVQTPAAAVKPKVPAAQHALDSDDDASPPGWPAPSAAAAWVKTEAEVAAFLRRVSPPLTDLSVALKACAGSGLSMAHLREMVNVPPAHYERAEARLATILGLRLAGDKFALMMALCSLAKKGAAR